MTKWHVVIQWGAYSTSTRWFDDFNTAVQHWNDHINDFDLTSMKLYRPDFTLFANWSL